MFEMLPRVPVFFRFNDRDDLFPAQTSILFRQSAEKHIDMECLAIGGTYLTGLLIKGKK
jgi:dienelactone hydrolase